MKKKLQVEEEQEDSQREKISYQRMKKLKIGRVPVVTITYQWKLNEKEELF